MAVTAASPPSPPTFLRDVVSAIEAYSAQGEDGDVDTTRDLEAKLSLAAAMPWQKRVQSAVAECERAMSEGRGRVREAVAAWREGARDEVAEQCRARDEAVAAWLGECEEVMAWASRQEEEMMAASDAERARDVMAQVRAWQEAKGDVEQLMLRVDAAVAGLQGPEDKLLEADNLLRKMKLRYKRRDVSKADVAEAERRLDGAREEASRASAALREAREALAAHEAAYPEVAMKL